MALKKVNIQKMAKRSRKVSKKKIKLNEKANELVREFNKYIPPKEELTNDTCH